MRPLMLLVVACLAIATAVTVAVVTEPSSRGVVPVRAAENGVPAAPEEYLAFKQGSGKRVTLAQVRRARRQAGAIAARADAATWELIGPANIGGRVVDVVVDPSQADTIYIAASGGGVWKSTDAGMTYTPAWPADYIQNMGALARGSDGTLWAGTGEANPQGGGLTFTGDGVYKSTDGGQIWQNVGLRDSAAIGRIVVNPQNANEVWVAAAGWISYSAPQRGIYHTTDGGQNWELELAPPAGNGTTGGIDVALAPGNPSRVYASLWDHKRNNGARTYGGVGSGLFRSDNSGATWTRLQNIVGQPCAWDGTGTGLAADASLGRIGVAIAPSDANRVYVVSGSPYGPDKGFYFSVDGGDSFICGGQAYQTSSGYQWWFGRLWVDPVDPNHLFNADVSLRQSLNAGLVWAPVTGPHADQHGMDWDPNVPNRVYLGNDGGVYRSDNNGTTWIHATYEPWVQSYHLAVSQQRSARLATGLQDNGSIRTWTPANPNPTDLTQWNSFAGGDGHYVLIDPTDDTWYYECFQPSPPSQSCASKHDTGTTTTTGNFSNAGWPAGMRWTTDTPIALDPTNPSVVYIGGTVLGRSTNRGANFTVISPADDANSLPGPVPPEQNDLGPFYANEYATISSIAPAKTAPNTIYVGTDTGRVWKTTDLGANWTRLTGLPDRWVNSLVVDPTDASHVFAAFSGYREGDHSANVWESTNGGGAWTNISTNLPNAPIEMLEYDQGRDLLYAATDFGVFYLLGANTSWTRLGTGLPNSPVLDVKLSGDKQTVFAATFGRSVLKTPAPSPTGVALTARGLVARSTSRGIALSWRTRSEAEVAGFNLYRSAPGAKLSKLNRSLIRAKRSGSVRGAGYEFLDRRVRTGVLYTYKIELVDLRSRQNSARSVSVRR